MRRFMLGALRRLIILALAAALTAAGSGIFAWKYGYLSATVPDWAAGIDPMLVAGIALGCGLLLLPVVLVRDQPDRGWHRLTLDPQTSISLSDRSLCALIAYEGQTVPGVETVSSTLRLTRKGWRIRCRVSVDATEKYGEVIQGTLSDRIRQAMESITGVPVERLALNLSFTLPHSSGRVR